MQEKTESPFEYDFIRWQRGLTKLTAVRWVIPIFLVFIIALPFYYLYALPMIETKVTISGGDKVVMAIIPPLYLVLIVLFPLIIKRGLPNLAKGACVFTAGEAAKHLESGNPVKASLAMNRLLLAISHLLQKKSVTLMRKPVSSFVDPVAPKDIMYITPETIPRKAVYQAIQASEETGDFQERLNNLAIQLQENEESGYIAAQKFIVWLDQKIETYKPGSQTFLEKHPTFRTVLQVVGPVIVPPLGLLAVELVRRLLVAG